MVNIHMGLGGHFTIHKGKLDDNDEPVTREYVTDFDNLVLDGGLQRIGENNDWMRWLHLGTGITAPSPLQTSLVNPTYKGTEVRSVWNTSGVDVEDPLNPYCWVIRTFRVSPRGESRTYSELGVGWDVNNLFSRTLIKDASGGQNTITILGDEYLDVTYEARIYIPVDTTVYTVTPTGDDLEPREITVHASRINIASTRFGWAIGDSARACSICNNEYPDAHNEFFDGGSGGLYLNPEGKRVGGTFNYSSRVRTSSTSMVFNFEIGLPKNVGTLRTLQVSQEAYCFQMEFNPPFVKTSEDRFNLSYSISWGRR